MLKELPGKRSRRQVFRLANIPENEELIEELGFDSQSIDELRELLANSGRNMKPDELCDGPFRSRRRLRNRTRFSDGSFPVFYSSLDIATAEAEVRYWFPRVIGKPRNSRPAYYQAFECTFDGTEVDLRPKLADWPDLIHDRDYTFCNRIGSEARRMHIDGLLTHSAGYEGVNLPIFVRKAIIGPKLMNVVAVTYHPATGKVIAVRQPV